MAHIKVAQVNKKHGNAGTCKAYINYLDKENDGKVITEKEYFFNDKDNFIPGSRAQELIDNAPKGAIRGKDAKYFEIIMSFEGKELSGKSDKQLKEFVQEAFPRIYGTSVKGKQIDPEKLIWVAKLEHQRKYKGTDQEVINGTQKKGEIKAGDQRHFHIIVARKISDNAVSISPLSNYRDAGKGVIKSGFDRNHFRQAYETEFDKKFNYSRPLEDSFRYQNTIKHGSPEEKKEMQELFQETKQYQEPILNIPHLPYGKAQEEEEDEERERSRKKGRSF